MKIKMNSYKLHTVNFFLSILGVFFCITWLFLSEEAFKHLTAISSLMLVVFAFTPQKSSWKNLFSKHQMLPVFVFYTLTLIVYKLVHDAGTTDLRIMLSTLVFVVLFSDDALIFVKKHSHYLLFIASIIVLAFSYYQSVVLGLVRQRWEINPIPYTTYAASVCVLSFVLLLESKDKLPTTLLCFSFILSLSSIIVSQTRGTLLALIVAIIVVLLYTFTKSKTLLKVLPIIVVGAASVLWLSKNAITERVSQTYHEYHQIQQGNYSTSIGQRLEMWETAYEIVPFPNFIGLGKEHRTRKKELSQTKNMHYFTVNAYHYHNQFIDAYVKKGLVGLAGIVLLLGFPFYYFFKERGTSSLGGVAVALGYTVSSMTDVPFNHPQTTIAYVVLCFILLSKPSGQGAT
jgi:O-antigen ligase